MKRMIALALILGGAAAACSPAAVTTATKPDERTAPAVEELKQPKLDFQEFTLENGLKVIIAEQHHAPVYTLCLTYNVGSRDEVKGRTGFAHLFEHMMFQGSENVGKAEHFVLVSNNGGWMNGSTSFDRTNYFEMLPANQLELALFLESDRMRSLDLSQENLDNQRNAVQEERRMRYDNRPYGKTMETLFGLAYDNFSYKHSTIGSMEDLNAATLEDVRSFFKTYYAPNNATLVLVGDVETQAALALVKKYFGDISAQPAPTVPDETEKLNKGERRKQVEDKMAPLERVDVLFPAAPGDHADMYALDLLSTILGGGESSRIYQRLVKEKQLATAAGTMLWMLRGSGPFWAYAMVAPGQSSGEVEQTIREEIERVKTELVTEDELARAKTTARADLVDALSSPVSTAIVVGQLAVYFGKPELINQQGELYSGITAEDLKRVANKYLSADNRNTLVTKPAPKQPPEGAASGAGQ